MVEDEYVSIQEAARRCGVSGKTIQRAIQAGKLMARYPKPNQCEIAMSALETFRLGQVSGQAPNPADLECRIVTLERRLSEMERLVEQLRTSGKISCWKRRRELVQHSLVLRNLVRPQRACPFLKDSYPCRRSHCVTRNLPVSLHYAPSLIDLKQRSPIA